MASARFNVFGRIVDITRVNGMWHTVQIGQGGKRSTLQLGIPPDLPRHELAQYLYDIYHESAAGAGDVIEIETGSTP